MPTTRTIPLCASHHQGLHATGKQATIPVPQSTYHSTASYMPQLWALPAFLF